MVEINWLTAFIDLPAERFDAGVQFWLAATGAELSAPRGDDQQFATLLPSSGDAHLRVQRVANGPPRIHLDLHVDSVPEAAVRAEAIGATMIDRRSDDQLVLMTSPGGLVFCLVNHHGETQPGPPVTDPAPHVFDQICIDIPSSMLETEVAFWASLTGWNTRGSSLGEFTSLQRPPHSPLRLLLQELGQTEGPTTAHLDLSCGTEVAAVAKGHQDMGAEIVDVRPRWTVMRDPAGMIYCLTFRDPATGLPPL